MKLGGPLKEKCITVTVFWAPWKQSSPLIHCSCCWAPFESKVGYFAHYSCKGGPRQVPRLPSLKHTTVYKPDNDLVYENMKPIEHVLLRAICVLSHLMCACKHCNVKSSLYYWTHWSCWWVYHFKKHGYHAIFHNNLERQAVAYAENFHGGVWFKVIWWLFVFGVRCLWRHNLTSFPCLQTNVLAKFVDIRCIFFYIHSPCFMCHCTEYKLSAVQVRLSEKKQLNATTQQFITAKISGWALK